MKINKLHNGAVFFLLAVITTVNSILSRFHVLDDTLIYYRYIRNALEGWGLVYNKGEFFNGLTSPLYTYLALAASYIFRDIHTANTFLGGLFLLLTSWIIYILLKRHNFPLLFAAIPSFLMVSTQYFYLVIGMETNLYLFLLVLSIYLFLEKKYFALSFAAPFLFLTRGESAFLIIILIIFHFTLKRKFPKWYVFIIPFIILAGNYIFNFVYYGEMLPHTLSVKIMQGSSCLWGEFSFFKGLFFINWHETKSFYLFNNFFSILLFGLAGAGIATKIFKSMFLQIYLLFLVLLALFYVYFNIPYYLWYYAPFLIFAYLGFSYFIKVIIEWKISGKMLKAVSLLISFLFILNLQVNTLISLPDKQGIKEYKQAGLWIKNNTPANAKVACVEIGYIGWYSERYIIDILGLVNPYNADYIGRGDLTSWLNHYNPDYVLVHDPLWNMEASAKMLLKSGEYIPQKSFSVEGLTLLKKK